MNLGILILMYQFFLGKVAEIRLERNNYYNHIMGLQVRFLMCPELVRIRLLRNGVAAVKWNRSECERLLYSK